MNSIGEKIRFFRKRSGMSQIDLELEAGMASGALSRIEQGIVNPSKETILSLGKLLNLNHNEMADLFEIRPLYPTQTEIDEAIEEVKDRFQRPDVWAYLIDEWVNIYSASQGFIELLQISPEKLAKILGNCLYEVLFDENLPIRPGLDHRYIGEDFALEIARMRVEIPTLEESELFKRLMRIPEFPAIYEQAKLIPNSEIISPLNKNVRFKINGQGVILTFGRERLKKNPRFEVIEYFNPRPYSD